jgi:F-type H+-transporting ATPase subunit epsilon
MALPTKLTLEIVTPERPLVHETVDEVTLPGVEGELGILPGHTPLLTVLKVGVLAYRKGEERSYVAIAHGFAEALADRVTVLAQMAERAEEIDVTKAKAAQERAEQRLAAGGPLTDVESARESLAKASTRLLVASKARTR